MIESPSEAWARCRGFIEKALTHDAGKRTLAEVAEMVQRGDAHFWPGANCAVVTEWFVFPRSRVLNIWLMGGDVSELLGPMLAGIEDWAIANGASELMGGAYERPAWRKALGAVGFRPGWIIFSKELSA